MFFKALFDFKFETFVTRKVAAVLYGILTVANGLFVLFAIIQGFQTLTSAYYGRELGLVMVLLAPVAALVIQILLRVTFESSIALVSIAENTKK